MLTRADIGKKIYMYREPTKEDWGECATASLDKPKREDITLTDFHKYDGKEYLIYFDKSDGYVYPECCFKLVEEIYNPEIY